MPSLIWDFLFEPKSKQHCHIHINLLTLSPCLDWTTGTPLLSGINQKSLFHLWFVQNAAARHHIIFTLASLHSLPVGFAIDFKIWLITFKACLGLAPGYSIVNTDPIWPLLAVLDPWRRPFWSFQSQDSNVRVTVLLPSGLLDFGTTYLRRKGLQNE